MVLIETLYVENKMNKFNLRLVIIILTSFIFFKQALAQFPAGFANTTSPGTFAPPKLISTMYPYYYKYCASTQRIPKKGEGGGIGGHALMFLSQVCLDKSKGLNSLSPLVMCKDLPEYKSNPGKLRDPNLGTGVTVDSYLKNTIYMNIPGLDLFLGVGLLNGKEVLDEKEVLKISNYAVDKGATAGILFKKSAYQWAKKLSEKEFEEKLKSMSERERHVEIAKIAFGTGIAISYGRNLYCVNIPLNERLMRKMVKEANEDRKLVAVGTKYRGKFLKYGVKKDAVYDWDMFYKNCTHLSINSLARVTGIFPPVLTDLPFFKQFTQLAIPANYFVEIYDGLNRIPIDVDIYWADKDKRRVFEESINAGEGGFITQQPGTIVEEIPLYGTIGDPHSKNVKNKINLIHKNNDYVLQVLSLSGNSRRTSLGKKFQWFKSKVKNPFQSMEDFKEWFTDHTLRDYSLKNRITLYTKAGDRRGASFNHPRGKRSFEGLNEHYRVYLNRYNQAILKLERRRKSKYYKDRLAFSKKGDKLSLEYVKFIDDFDKFLRKKKGEILSFLK